MSETMTLIATIFEKCTGSNLCEPLKGSVGDTTATNANANANALLYQTIATNEARIAQLVKKIEAMEVRRIEMEEESERTGVIEEAYRKLEIEYKDLVDEADAMTARNSRISSALSASQSAGAGDDVVMNDLRSQITELLVVIKERNVTIEGMSVTIGDYTTRFNELKEIHEELAHKYYELTHASHSTSAVKIIVPGLTYKPEIAKYIELYGFPENFNFDDVKLGEIRWDMYGAGGRM